MSCNHTLNSFYYFNFKTVNSKFSTINKFFSEFLEIKKTISLGTLPMLTDDFLGFSQCLQVNAGTVLLLGYDSDLTNPLKFTLHHVIRRHIV
jgi:hypothetical protein